MSWRLQRVRQHLGDALDGHAGATRVLSVCAGDGRDLLGVLAERRDAGRVSAVLLELHPDLAQQRRDSAAAAGLERVQVRTVDASSIDAYLDGPLVEVLLMGGIFGNVADNDVWRLISFAPQLCRPGATLVWSRGRRLSHDLPGVTTGDLNDEVRARFAAAGFSEVAYETPTAAAFPLSESSATRAHPPRSSTTGHRCSRSSAETACRPSERLKDLVLPYLM